MCRWLAYTGAPLRLEELLLKPEHSLIDQSLASKEGVETTNGDGFGVGWYGDAPEPGIYKDPQPAWNDANLADLARHIESPRFIAHIRATTGTPVQRTNCHPFRHGRWLFVHNGVISDFARVRRDLAFEIDPALFPSIQGTTDSEIMFNLALTFGLESEPLAALEQMAWLVEKMGADQGVVHPLQMTLGLSDGERIYAVRYSSERQSRSLYHSKSVEALRQLDSRFERLSEDARAIVSEPLSEMTEQWVRIPESTALVVETGHIETQAFEPRPPP